MAKQKIGTKMDKNLDYYLVKKYPSIFRERFEPTTKTNMCWGFECDDGWFKIIDAFCEQAHKHIESQKTIYENWKKHQTMLQAGQIEDLPKWIKEDIHQNGGKLKEVPEPCDLVIQQVKEKFGMLRIYYSGGDNYIDGLNSFAGYLSAHTCEECAQPGKIRNGGYIRTLCDEHAQKNNYSLEPIPVQEGDIIEVLTHEGAKICKIEQVISQEEVKVSLYEYFAKKNEPKQTTNIFFAFLVKTPLSEFWDSQQ